MRKDYDEVAAQATMLIQNDIPDTALYYDEGMGGYVLDYAAVPEDEVGSDGYSPYSMFVAGVERATTAPELATIAIKDCSDYFRTTPAYRYAVYIQDDLEQLQESVRDAFNLISDQRNNAEYTLSLWESADKSGISGAEGSIKYLEGKRDAYNYALQLIDMVLRRVF